MNWRSLLAPEIVQKIEAEIDEAYHRGWTDCLERIAACVQQHRSSKHEPPARAPQTPTGRTPRTVWMEFVTEALRKHGGPMRIKDLLDEVSHLAKRPVPRASVYAALEKLREEGRVERGPDRRWQLRYDARESVP